MWQSSAADPSRRRAEVNLKMNGYTNTKDMTKQRIAIIGGGFTGLTAAYMLSQHGHSVELFEKEPYLGGLAHGFKSPGWDWYIESAYHHLFTNDTDILTLAKELGLSDALIRTRPVTASLWHHHLYQLDSPVSLFAFPGLSFTDKLRTAFLLGLLKITPLWQPLEHITAEQLLVSIGGNNAFNTIWKPLLYGKFSDFAPSVSAAWFWARIKKRTPSLIYIRGGFHTLVSALEKAVVKNGGVIHTSTAVTAMKKISGIKYHVSWNGHKKKFDVVLLTIPTPLSYKLIPDLPKLDPQFRKFSDTPHLHAQTLIVETDKPILSSVYWLNVTDMSYPFLAAVAHTNFMDPTHYGGHHLTYFGNYLPQDHPYLSMTKEQLLKKFMPYIKRISPDTGYRILDTYLFTGPFAQPVHTRGYSQTIPPMTTPLPGIYMANMDYIAPWDRGTNYAVELGKRAAECILKDAK